MLAVLLCAIKSDEVFWFAGFVGFDLVRLEWQVGVFAASGGGRVLMGLSVHLWGSKCAYGCC